MSNARKAEQEAEDRAREAKQSACDHYRCTITRVDFQGRICEVTCDDCGLSNEVDHE